VHHSIEAHHQDRNYGALLSVWDWIFGTQIPDNKVYPRTGISDDEFPSEQSVRGLQLLIKPVQQMLYSFRLIGRSMKQLY
jgi:sterol desaturase/sphingolipid hydroxylase (fatty acid hydroxylase superfamily)